MPTDLTDIAFDHAFFYSHNPCSMHDLKNGRSLCVETETFSSCICKGDLESSGCEIVPDFHVFGGVFNQRFCVFDDVLDQRFHVFYGVSNQRSKTRRG
jgi:hypothetical protein